MTFSSPISLVTRQGIRPLDPSRDLPAVVELISLGFKGELGPQGRKMLQDMRRAAENTLFSALAPGANASMPGYVWVEDEQVVANLSLRKAAASGGRGWIVGNVVVHPAYRRRGIGQALMEAALAKARAAGGQWMGLEVRANNGAALQLYRQLGFRGVGKTLHLLRDADSPWPEFPEPHARWRQSTSDDRRAWIRLARAAYRDLQRRVLEFHPGRFDFGGWERTVMLWLRREREWAWITPGPTPQRAVHVRTDKGHKFHLWELFTHPRADEKQAQETIARALPPIRHHPQWAVVTTIEERAPTIPLLLELGFHRHRTLQQMFLDL